MRPLALRGIDWTARELLARSFLPRDFSVEACSSDAGAEPFDLSAVGLYDETSNQPHQRGPIRGFLLANGILWPSSGGIRTDRGQLLADSMHSSVKLRFAMDRNYFCKYPSKRIRGPVASLGHINRNYYHKLIDSIPRIYGLWHPTVMKLSSVQLIVDGRYGSEELALIEALIPKNCKLTKMGFCRRVHADLVVHSPFLSARRTSATPGWAHDSAGYLPNEYLKWFRDRTRSFWHLPRGVPSKKLFITRRDARIRRIIEEAELRRLLESKGFVVVELDGMTLSAQAELFASAAWIVAQHGAGLTNLIFCGPETRVLEFHSSAEQPQHYTLLSKSLGLRHRSMHFGGKTKNDDILIDRFALERVSAEIGLLNESA